VACAVFFGPAGAVAFGDYAAGSNHILPTGGAARFGRPLGVDVFRRRTSIVEMPPEAVTALAPRVATLARAEGFDVHGESAEARTEG
jgi:histidinol dehydrogenase